LSVTELMNKPRRSLPDRKLESEIYFWILIVERKRKVRKPREELPPTDYRGED
jgi:hypothetical protein